MNHSYTNRLIKETSPYLLQHAHNPVNWYAWNREAFDKAVAENKPILVSIGYSTCHWCHVMERESFENETIAKYMNEHFVNIKVDREERPDVDHIYMEAVQVITGQGGWPLNCFLLPDKRPFYGGTYFPPHHAYNRPSWLSVLQNIDNAFHHRRTVVETQAAKLIDIIKDANKKFINSIEGTNTTKLVDFSTLENIYNKIETRFDRVEGGFGNAPKFPNSMTLDYCLNYYYYTQNEEAKQHVLFSLDKMIKGGLYDQIGGGFARYATDKAWLIPHFEKMLYDNALLINILSDAYKITKSELYKETIIETLDFIEREMTSPEGGFYSAQDADSEGVEGKYYVWQKEEIETILGTESVLFCAFYGVTSDGNWEHNNILWRKDNYEIFAKKNNLNLQAFKQQLAKNRRQLFEVRNKRIHPSLDDKILLNWNALMCTAYAKAYSALGDGKYKEIAVRNLEFILRDFIKENEITLYHTYKEGEKKYTAFLDDYAFLIETLLEVHTITQKRIYLEKASLYTDLVMQNFLDEATKLFYFTSKVQEDVILRRKELYDNAIPSGISTMVHNLQKLGILLGREDYRKLASGILEQMIQTIEKHPISFSKWASAIINEVYPMPEIAIVGQAALTVSEQIQQLYVPNKVLMATVEGNSAYPLLEGKTTIDSSDKKILPQNTTQIYVCQNYACKRPVNTIQAFKKLVNYNL